MERAVQPIASRHSSRRWRPSPARSPTRSWRRCCAAADLDKAYVNNGGDIALHLAPGAVDATPAIAGTGHGLADRVIIRADDPVRGIATSGWRGRSFSLGIADAVTVLARTAAEADAAATMIANAVDLPGHPAIVAHAGQ